MSDFVYREPAKIVQDIIQSELDLVDGQVMFTNQKFFIPTDPLYIVVSYVGPSRVFVNANRWEDAGPLGLYEVQSVNFEHLIQIDIMSFDDEARIRKEEIAMALRSVYSEQLQEQYNMSIARNTGVFVDTSFLEETKIVTRYTTTIKTLSRNEKTKTVDYYTTFKGQLNIDPQQPVPIDVSPAAAHP